MNPSRLHLLRALSLPCLVAFSFTFAVAPSAQHQVSITTEGDFRFIKSNGWPDHEPGAFPRKGNPNTASPQSYSFRVPLKPTVATQPPHLFGWWGVALNGVPFEPGTGETWQNNPQSGWRYEAATGFLDLGLDEHNAHVQPTGAYHYHALPLGLMKLLGGDETKMLMVGYAADGFPVYTSKAYATASDAKSELRVMKSSYKLKSGARPTQAGGPGGNYDGRFTQDWEYVAGSGDLDELNGRTGVTPEYPEGTYYYCITGEFPFVARSWRGTPDESFAKRGPPPGMGGPGRRGGPGGPGRKGGPPPGPPPGGDPLRGTFLPDFP
jgi:YHYH protein